ncbi:MAG: hypothetical protein AABY22_22565, partial [Nanoarchaeota archaeon]
MAISNVGTELGPLVVTISARVGDFKKELATAAGYFAKFAVKLKNISHSKTFAAMGLTAANQIGRITTAMTAAGGAVKAQLAPFTQLNNLMQQLANNTRNFIGALNKLSSMGININKALKAATPGAG